MRLTEIATVAEGTRFACLVAARTCERAGASPPWPSELSERMTDEEEVSPTVATEEW